MIAIEPERMAAMMEAVIVARGEPGPPRVAAIDSREITGGELFFGLAGESDDGGRLSVLRSLGANRTGNNAHPFLEMRCWILTTS